MEKMITQKISIAGMSCPACGQVIEKKLKKSNGMIKVNVNYVTGVAAVTYDHNQISHKQIEDTIRQLGYQVVDDQNQKSSPLTLIYLGLILFGIYIIIRNTIGFDFFPQVTQSMGYGMLFVAGLFTSVHCLAMCGGISLSQCASNVGQDQDAGVLQQLKPGLLYNLGRVVSYTFLGGVVGTLGSVISISPSVKAAITVFAGIFMVMMGFNMLGMFGVLKRWIPRLPQRFVDLVEDKKSGKTPFVVGLLNGFMPCGPLQAMQLYALGTGGFVTGAISMFLFSLGTVPLMLAFSVLSMLVHPQFKKQMMKVSAMLVIALGLVMGNRGLSLAGVDLTDLTGIGATKSGSIKNDQQIAVKDGYQIIETDLESGRYPTFSVKAGIPVKWIITAEKGDLNGCNNEIIIPSYQLSKPLAVGQNIIEFTPDTAGVINYSCWMGMIRGKIIVEE